MIFEWDERKNRHNQRKHLVRFELATLVFEDPWAFTLRDELHEEEERWITIGALGPHFTLVVVHTWGQHEGDEVVRIISARKAIPSERDLYENARKALEE
jgi:uncharacterized protein